LREGVWNTPVWVASPPAAGGFCFLARRRPPESKFAPALLQKRWDYEFVFIVGSLSFGKEIRQGREMKI